MTLAAPKSRQGKFILVLAFLAATVAVLGALVWANTARADLDPDATVTFNALPATVPVGGAISLTATVDITTAPSGTTTNTTLEWNSDPNLIPVSAPVATGSPWSSGECANGTNFYGTLECVDANGPAADATVQVSYVALPVFDFALQSPATQSTNIPLLCELTDDGTGTELCTDQQDFGFIDPWIIGGDNTTNPPNQPHDLLFTLPVGVTCQSDNNLNDQIRSCDPSDVTIFDPPVGSMTLQLGTPLVLETDINQAGDVLVTIDSLQETQGTITLDVKYDFQGTAGTSPNNITELDLLDPVAFKDYSIVCDTSGPGPGCEIRHRDEADQGAEDAAFSDLPNLDDYCVDFSVAFPDCGILAAQDDADDAVGSFHQACLVYSNLTHTDNSQYLTWNIAQGPGSSATVNPNPNGQKVAGPNDIPCVRWGSAGTGSQTITATYDNGVDAATTFYWSDGTTPLPLIKEWNDLDETKIVEVDGYVGDDLTSGTDDLDDWGGRDCSFDPVDSGFCTSPNVDGLTLAQEATIILALPQLLVSAPPVSFIDYTLGSHDDAGGSYDGPIDGAEQTYTISGDCGSVRVEDPQSGQMTTLINDGGPTSVTVLSSDKGVGFTFLPNNTGATATTISNADCGPNAEICIGIETEEDNLFDSGPLQVTLDEEICVVYNIGPPTSKTPQLAWAGQRVVIEHFWGSVDSSGNLVCDDLDFGAGDADEFGVLYSVQAGTGSFTAALQGGGFNDIDQSGQNVIVDVDRQPVDEDQDGEIDPNSGCISRVIFENQDQGQVDIIAYVVDDNDDLNDADPRSQQVAFVIYYMKFEDVKLTLVPGERANHNSGAFIPDSPLDSSDDVTEMIEDDAVNVSADVLARLRVRGWVSTTNCPVRDSGEGANGEFLPANRCIFPDDWQFKAGGGVGDNLNDAVDDTTSDAGFAEESRPNFDILGVAPAAPTNQAVCNSAPRASGPFSWLDTNVQGDTSAAPCADSLAPNVSGASANVCLYSTPSPYTNYGCREVVFPNGVINAWDAPMPPALARFALSGAGFLRPADKDGIYAGDTNLFYTAHIPAEPWIAPINNDLSGYQWNTWGGPGAKSGQYQYWTSLADSSAEVLSCAGPSSGATFVPNGSDPCISSPGTGVRTGGYTWTKVYTDNHGEAMTWINGDANLSFDDCDSSAGATDPDHMIVLLSGYYCEDDDLVGSSWLSASVDYPDKRKHFAIQSNDVHIDWTWGGIKEVTIEPGENAQFNYVVFHVTDRDGECRAFNNTSGQQTLHSVLDELVVFVIDSPTGIIFPNAAGIPAALLGDWDAKSAAVFTFDTGDVANASITQATWFIDEDECQAWIHISESQFKPVNVIITAYDPEGTVTFDKLINPPAPPPTAPPTAPPPPTPSPTPANQANLWADIDCSNKVDPVDALKMLIVDAGNDISQAANCPAPNADLDLIWDGQNTNEKWGDADCSGSIVTPVDALKVLRFDAGLFTIQNEPCPDIGQEVLIPLQS